MGCWDGHGTVPSARSFADEERGSPSLRRQNSLPWKLLNHKAWSVQKCFQSRAVCGAASAMTLFSRRVCWKWPCGRESIKRPRDWGKGFGDLQGMSSEVSCSWTSASFLRWGLTAPTSWIPASGLMPVSLCLFSRLKCSTCGCLGGHGCWFLPVLFSKTRAAEVLEGSWCLIPLWGKGCVTWEAHVCKSFFSPTQGKTRKEKQGQSVEKLKL